MICCFAVSAQKSKDTYFLYDKDWNSVADMEKAAFFMHVVAESDTQFVCRTYSTAGSMINQESYRDKNLELPHGKFIWYDAKGRIDSVGNVVNKKKDGQWLVYNDTFGIDKIYTYNVGKLVEWRDFNRNVMFTPAEGEKPIQKRPDDSSKIVITQEKEAVFKGGLPALKKYLERSLGVPQRLVSLGLSGDVKCQFLIDKEGNINDITILQSLEWAADAEGLRVMKAMPRWQPAMQNGKPVIYQCIQKISFEVNRY